MTGWGAESVVFAVVEWGATEVVLVITALGAFGKIIIDSWKTNAGVAKVNEKVEVTNATVTMVHEKVKESDEKLAIIEKHTNGMNTVLEATVKNLGEELKALRAENLAAMTSERNLAQAKVETQTADIMRRADASLPSKEKP